VTVLLATAMLAAPVLGAQSTAYCITGTMADGTVTRAGSAASNRHPLGTRITVLGGGPGGLRRWTVRDRIGHSSQLDFWQPSCGAALAWGRRTVRYRLGWARVVLRARLLSSRLRAP
jgi:3D (Asp-Asp-Asp) domain-containing protein